MPRRNGRYFPSRRYKQMCQRIDVSKTYTIQEAVELLKTNRHKAKFDETVELGIKLDVDTRQADQNVRGSFGLPNGTGKSVRVIAFCEGDMAKEALEAGAVRVGGEDLANAIQKDQWMDFDVAIAHPSMMRFVGRLGRVLGPKGLMPSPKGGTVTPNVTQAVKEFQAGKVEFRNDKNGNVQIPVGKVSFEAEQLVENIEAFVHHITALRPATVKGRYVAKIVISTTMGPGLKVGTATA